MSQNPYQQPQQPQQNPYAAPTSNVVGGDTYGTQGEVAQSTIQILAATKGWVRFLAVICFIAGGIVLIATFAGASMTPGMPGGAAGISILITLAMVMIGYVIPGIYMNSYASKIGTMMMNPATVTLDAALNVQRGLYKYLGIVFIVFVSFFILMLVAFR